MMEKVGRARAVVDTMALGTWKDWETEGVGSHFDALFRLYRDSKFCFPKPNLSSCRISTQQCRMRRAFPTRPCISLLQCNTAKFYRLVFSGRETT